jgi:hypothetical protein
VGARGKVGHAILLLLLVGCGSGQVVSADDTGLDGLALVAVSPATLLPGTRVVVAGHAFVDEPWGTSALHLQGEVDGVAVDVRLPAAWQSDEELVLSWPGAAAVGMPGGGGTFVGTATVEVESPVDQRLHVSAPRPLTLGLRESLEPRIDTVQTGVIFVNEQIVVEGDGFLLGGDEGETVAVVEGCYRREGTSACLPVPARTVSGTPDSPFDRTRLSFAFAPEIAGIRPGDFVGQVRMENHHGEDAGAVVLPAPAWPIDFTIVPPRIFSFSPTTASLGQYVDIRGGGFVGLPPDAPDQTQLVTLIHFVGTFTPAAAGGAQASAVDLTLIPEFESGARVRYVMNEEDELGQRVDLRRLTGTFAGTATPIIQHGSDEVIGDPVTVSLEVAPVKQVVWLHFLPSYVESLRHFGLRALDARIRARVLAVARRDYAGVNVEFRTSQPTDFAAFAQVDIAGPDPNGLGLLGYDNSPGKDLGNLRLYDRIGGVNATTQEDGYPGFGGVFVESFFGFSLDPGGFAKRLDGGASPVFDAIFDPFRPDRGGRPVLAADVAAGVPDRPSGAGCERASGRAERASCAVWVLGSMIGTTMTHEVGHSLGLANPTEPQAFHNSGDEPNRLMDSGGARTFLERAELMGEGPAVFCDGEYAYLREILPAPGPAAAVTRPRCN